MSILYIVCTNFLLMRCANNAMLSKCLKIHSTKKFDAKSTFTEFNQSKAYISFEHSEYIDEIPKWKEIYPQAEFNAKHQTT